MLVVTSESLPQDPEGLLACPWHGPRVLVLLPGNELSRVEVRDFATTHYVVDFLQRPASTGALLNDVLSFLRHEVERAEWPLVYFAQPLESGTIDAVARLVVDRPHEVSVAFDANDRLVRLSLGEMVASSPLLPEFFAMMSERNVDDRFGADLLRATFGGLDA